MAESPNQNPQTQDLPPLQDLAIESQSKAPPSAAMTETEKPQAQPQSAAAGSAAKFSNASFSIWPPTEKTRDAVRNRLIETLSTPSILSKRYGTISSEEAVDAAKRIEEEAFEAAGRVTGTDDDGIEILQIYSKEISKRMLDTVKSRSEAVAAAAPPEAAAKAEEEDAGSTAPPQSEKSESVAGDE